MLANPLWKIATGGAAILVIILAVVMFKVQFENRQLVGQRNQLSERINDPKTGFIVQLAQARTNVAQLEKTISVQNTKIEQLNAEGRARLAESARQLELARAERDKLERRLNGFLATSPQGATLEDRVRDIDQRAMKEFLP